MPKKEKISKEVCDILNAEWDESQEECKVKTIEGEAFTTEIQSMNWGKLVKNPEVIFRAIINGEESPYFFGDFTPIDNTYLARVVSMTIDKGILSTADFIKENDVMVELYKVSEDKRVIKRLFKGKDLDTWNEI